MHLQFIQNEYVELRSPQEKFFESTYTSESGFSNYFKSVKKITDN